MSSEDKIILSLGMLGSILITFILGYAIGTPDYNFSDNVKSKLKQDATSNYRTEHEQIRFIIDSYYSDHKDANKTERELNGK